MTTAIAERPSANVSTTLTAADIRAQVNLIQDVMKSVMKPDVHYGTIPGTNKPTLYKPGAEVLCAMFRIRPEFEIVDLSTDDAYRYRVTCRGVHQATGIALAEGVGSASSNEEKYKWRRAVCDEEFEETPENRRRIKYGSKRNGGFYRAKQIRAQPDDIDNTVLKMACKRASVAMTLNATAASDIFTQDIEDLPEGMRGEEEAGGGDPEDGGRIDPPRGRGDGDSGGETKSAASETKATDNVVAHVRKLAGRKNITDEALCKAIGVEKLDGITIAKANEAMKAIQEWKAA